MTQADSPPALPSVLMSLPRRGHLTGCPTPPPQPPIRPRPSIEQRPTVAASRAERPGVHRVFPPVAVT